MLVSRSVPPRLRGVLVEELTVLQVPPSVPVGLGLRTVLVGELTALVAPPSLVGELTVLALVVPPLKLVELAIVELNERTSFARVTPAIITVLLTPDGLILHRLSDKVNPIWIVALKARE